METISGFLRAGAKVTQPLMGREFMLRWGDAGKSSTTATPCACAVGAAKVGAGLIVYWIGPHEYAGWQHTDDDSWRELCRRAGLDQLTEVPLARLPAAVQAAYLEPRRDGPATCSLYWLMTWLNDGAGWSREAIADLLERLGY